MVLTFQLRKMNNTCYWSPIVVNKLKIVAGQNSDQWLSYLEGKEIRKPPNAWCFSTLPCSPWLTVQENIRLAVDEVLKDVSIYR
jgi:ABC-type nitrate/sulfonate/bicarbonate transport system ATPase subunit